MGLTVVSDVGLQIEYNGKKVVILLIGNENRPTLSDNNDAAGKSGKGKIYPPDGGPGEILRRL